MRRLHFAPVQVQTSETEGSLLSTRHEAYLRASLQEFAVHASAMGREACLACGGASFSTLRSLCWFSCLQQERGVTGCVMCAILSHIELRTLVP